MQQYRKQPFRTAAVVLLRSGQLLLGYGMLFRNRPTPRGGATTTGGILSMVDYYPAVSCCRGWGWGERYYSGVGVGAEVLLRGGTLPGGQGIPRGGGLYVWILLNLLTASSL